MVRSTVKVMVTLAFVLLVLLQGVSPASAHTVKDVGAYKFTVGWSTEPAYAGQLNSVQLVLATLSDGKPYTALTDTLKVTVMYEQQSTTYALTPTFDADTGFGTPGDYRAWFFPTAPGNYTFRFVGTIGSQKVDESFTSGPTTFGTVEDPASAQFPMKAPSNVELAARIGADSSRNATQSQVSSAKTLGYVGIAVGAVGVVLAAAALFVRRRA
jgi:hypothetical protein